MRSSCSKHRPAALRAARPLRRWLFLLAALSIFGAVAVPAAVADGVCFVWDTNGRSATLTGLTQQQCEPHPPGWNRGKWIEGGSINDNGLPIFAGDPPRPGDVGYWRYVVLAGDGGKKCKCEGNVCKEWQQLVRCWWLEPAPQPNGDPNQYGRCSPIENVDDPNDPNCWVIVCSDPNACGGCHCVQLTEDDQANYGANGACQKTNFHYWWRCIRSSGWFSATPPGAMRPPNGMWFQTASSIIPPTAVGDHIWYSAENVYVPTNEKTWTITITGPDADKFGVVSVHGYRDPDDPYQPAVELSAAVTSIQNIPGPPKKRIITVILRPQPGWETIELVRTAERTTDAGDPTTASSSSACAQVTTSSNMIELSNAWFGVPEVDDMLIREVTLFPLNVPIDPAAPHLFDAPPWTGNWNWQPIWVDPFEVPRPNGGIIWVTDGPGLEPNDMFTLTMYMIGPADTTYDMFAMDVTNNQHHYFRLYHEHQYFTELFGAGDNDLNNLRLVFTPVPGSDNFYSGCVEPITQLPTDPTGGQPLPLGDDAYLGVYPTHPVMFYGCDYGQFFVGSNGYITFGSGDSSYNETFFNHFNLPRISGLFDDLNPAAGGQVSWKELADRTAVTWLNVPEFSTRGQNTFQIELFHDGQLTLNYLNLDASNGLAGLSRGEGVPIDFAETDLSGMGCCPSVGACCYMGTCVVVPAVECTGQFMGPGTACSPDPCQVPSGACCINTACSVTTQADCEAAAGTYKGDGSTCVPDPCAPQPPVATSAAIVVNVGTPTPITLQASDDGLPNPPGMLTYLVIALPQHGSLAAQGEPPISSVPYTIPGGGNTVVYTPGSYYQGPDGFLFKANDGGTPPEGGDSNIGGIAITVVQGPTVCRGDCNCDGQVNWRDIDYFVAAMTSQAAWEAMFLPGMPSCLYGNNDVNADGTVNWRDIDPFVAVMGTSCP